MLSFFAHAGHDHYMSESMETIEVSEDYLPIFIGIGIVIALLLSVIAYLLLNWQPKPVARAVKKHASKHR